MQLIVRKFVTGPIETNTYVVSGEQKACIIIDPSSGCDEILEYIKNKKFYVEAICLTHGHFDHFLGLEEILSVYPDSDVWIHSNEVPFLRNPEYNGSYMIGMDLKYKGPLKEFSEGVVQISSFEIRILEVPGHSPGGCALVIENYCFSGDSLFAGSIGRTDFPGCDGPA